MTPVLEVRGISKQFPGALANDNVDFDLQPGRFTLYWAKTGPAKPP